jgi:hypothetical protein
MTNPIKIIMHIQNMNPDNDINAQKNSPNVLNIYSSFDG